MRNKQIALVILLCLLFFSGTYENPKPSKAEFYGKHLNQIELVNIIDKVNQNYGYDIEILIALCYQESRFNQYAVCYNKDGTKDNGYYQLNSKYFNSPIIYDPLVNVTLGIAYFDDCMKRSNCSTRKALYLYNSGKTFAVSESAEKRADDIILYAMNLKEQY